MTQQVSRRPIKCQSRLWSLRGTKVNGSHHGDKPLLRPTGIQIATKSCATLQAMAKTNVKTVHQTSLFHIEGNLDRLDTEVSHQLFPQNLPGPCLRFSRTGVQPSPGPSTIELPSAFAESGAYPPDRALPGFPRQCSLVSRAATPPEGYQIGARKRRASGNTILSQPYRRRVSTESLNREGSQLAASLGGEPGPKPAGKTLQLIPRNQVSEGTICMHVCLYLCMGTHIAKYGSSG